MNRFASASRLGKANRCLPAQLAVRGGPLYKPGERPRISNTRAGPLNYEVIGLFLGGGRIKSIRTKVCEHNLFPFTLVNLPQ